MALRANPTQPKTTSQQKHEVFAVLLAFLVFPQCDGWCGLAGRSVEEEKGKIIETREEKRKRIVCAGKNVKDFERTVAEVGRVDQEELLPTSHLVPQWVSLSSCYSSSNKIYFNKINNIK